MTRAPGPNENLAALRRVWAVPLAVGAVTALGLSTALFTEGPLAQSAACLAVGAPILVLAGLALRKRARSR